jgi:hypothetical protein
VNANPALEQHTGSERSDMGSDVEISVHPMEQFLEDLRKELVQQLTPAYPHLPELNREAVGALDPVYREEHCDQLRDQIAEHKLTLAYSELGGGSYYQHDLLWRLWEQFPATDSGERAFVLLLDFGWDTSSTCAKGADLFREVILQGESFLQQHSNSPYRDYVVHLVGQAYSTYWSLSKQPTPAMADYVDPKLYQEGSEQARLKAGRILRAACARLAGKLAGRVR